MGEYAENDVVVPQVDEIACYYNTKANIVIRQRNPMGDDDAVIVVPHGHAKALIKKLQALVKSRPEPDREE